MKKILDPKEVGKALFAKARLQIPSADELCKTATSQIISQLGQTSSVKANFSELVESIQERAYELYLAAEAEASTRVINEEVLPANVDGRLTPHSFSVLNAYFLSLSQSRKARAGSTFEAVVTYVFEKLEYPFTSQPDLGESRPDYILPSLEYYHKFSADCIIFTCKRTLRERWRQVLTEGISGKAFFLATIDEKISLSELDRVKGRSIYVVVPKSIKSKKYSNALNVITFEQFLADHLDPAVKRWKQTGALE